MNGTATKRAKEPLSADRAHKARNPSKSSASRIDIMRASKDPLRFFTLVVIVVEALFTAVLTTGASKDIKTLIIAAMIGLIFLLIVVVAVMAVCWPDSLYRPVRKKEAAETTRDIIEERLASSPEIIGEEKPAPSVGVWYQEIRPVLHQAIQYTVPTYYLDVNLMIVDWNLAFDLVFSKLGSALRNKHVKYFIAELQNFDEVMGHAQGFTRNVLNGRIPFVDVEPLRYASEKYGEVRFLKVAAQLHDSDGRPRGWSVSLMICDIDWEPFEKDLLEEASKDKLWSVYSGSYDRVLLEYPPYKRLIQDVIGVVPSGRQSVVDLGAGTGNVTAALLEAGYAVTAVENNLGMLDRLRSKNLSARELTVVKSSIENLTTLADQSFDAAVMVNALYAVDDPLTCLHDVHRILKPGGVLGLSTTHAETNLDPLLNSIKARLVEIGKYSQLAGDFQTLYDLNKQIESVIAKRYTRDQYREWVRTSGFTIVKEIPSTYNDAVMLIHAEKK
jgi:ubiquinone/menaquinone biosynthesis C-methylase UbiE